MNYKEKEQILEQGGPLFTLRGSWTIHEEGSELAAEDFQAVFRVREPSLLNEAVREAITDEAVDLLRDVRRTTVLSVAMKDHPGPDIFAEDIGLTVRAHCLVEPRQTEVAVGELYFEFKGTVN